MALTAAQREALVAALHDVRANVRDRVLAFATALWNGLSDWRDADIDRFVAALLPRLEAGQLTVAKATDAYIVAMTGGTPAGVTDLSQVRADVSPADEYRRPAIAMRSKLANGATVTDALAAGLARLQSLASTDLQLAHTHQARASMKASGGVRAFRRVPSGSENCALCLIASTQRYWVADLMPIHPGCDCQVAPLGAGEHLNQVIDLKLLEATHDWVASRTGTFDRGGRAPDYRKLITVSQHGGYGPTLGWSSQASTPGPSAEGLPGELAPRRTQRH